MKSQKEQGKNFTDEELTDLAVDLILAVLHSADPDVIGPINWWIRAKSALETAASAAHSYQHMVSRCAEKLQIQTPQIVSSKAIFSIGKNFVDEKIFERFRYLCERDTIYIIAIARMKREEDKAIYKKNKKTN